MKETPHINNLYKNQQVLMNQVYLDGTRKRKRCDVSTGVMNFRERKEISKVIDHAEVKVPKFISKAQQ